MDALHELNHVSSSLLLVLGLCWQLDECMRFKQEVEKTRLEMKEFQDSYKAKARASQPARHRAEAEQHMAASVALVGQELGPARLYLLF